MKTIHFTIKSEVNQDINQVWEKIGTMEGANKELFPIKMSYPPSHKNLTPANFPSGEIAFKSTLSILGIIPIGFHRVKMDQLTPPYGFKENSISTGFQVFQHTRTIEDNSGRTIIQDEIRLVARSVYGSLMARFYPSTFKKRHKRLVRWFGGRTLDFSWLE